MSSLPSPWSSSLCAGSRLVRSVSFPGILAGLMRVSWSCVPRFWLPFIPYMLGNMAGGKEGTGAPSASTVLGFRPKNVTPEMVRRVLGSCPSRLTVNLGRNSPQHVP